MRFAIEGQIENVGAADIFLFLSQTQRTSVVAFERPEQETRVFFVDGQPVWCLSSKVQLQLESRLALGGAIKLRDIETALTRQNAGSGRIPQALIAELMATEASMEKDIRALALECLRDVATWTSGTFMVYDGVVPPPWAHTITPDFPSLLIEALRGQCHKETLQKEFISRKGILKARSVSRTSSGLNDAERTILTLVNGERTIEELVKRSGLEELAALSAMHVLCALHLTDLLAPQRGAKSGPEKSASGPVTAPPPLPPMPAPPPEPPPPQDRGGATDRFPVQTEKKQQPSHPPLPPMAQNRNADATVVHTGESTAKLPVLQDLPVAAAQQAPKAIVRTLRIASEDRNEDVVLTAATFSIGRHPRNDLVLKDPRISSFHCRVEFEGDKYVIVDLKSRNGTLLNQARIDRAVLKPNDRIQLGSTKITYLES
jgi:hypothetical protein